MHEYTLVDDLRYVPASDIEFAGLGGDHGINVRAVDCDTIGTLDGVVVDHGLRRIVYFVVRAEIARRTREHVVPSSDAWVHSDGSSIVIGVTKQILQHYPTLGDLRTTEAVGVADLVDLEPQS